MSDFPEYFGVLPASVRYDRCLSPGAKVLFADIGALCRLNGACWATNGYFAKLYDVSETCVSLWVSQLTKAGYVVPEEVAEVPENRREAFKKRQSRRLKIVKEGVQKKLKQNNTDTQGNKTDTQGNNGTPPQNESLLDRLLQASLERAAVSVTSPKSTDKAAYAADSDAVSRSVSVPESAKGKTSETNESPKSGDTGDSQSDNGATCPESADLPSCDEADAPIRETIGCSESADTGMPLPKEAQSVSFTAEAFMPDSLARRAFKACFGWEWGDARVHPDESPETKNPIRAVVSWSDKPFLKQNTPHQTTAFVLNTPANRRRGGERSVQKSIAVSAMSRAVKTRKGGTPCRP